MLTSVSTCRPVSDRTEGISHLSELTFQWGKWTKKKKKKERKLLEISDYSKVAV